MISDIRTGCYKGQLVGAKCAQTLLSWHGVALMAGLKVVSMPGLVWLGEQARTRSSKRRSMRAGKTTARESIYRGACLRPQRPEAHGHC